MTAAYFVPAYRFISSITNAQQAVVTFTVAHTYSDGEFLSFRTSPLNGMIEINQQQGKVLSHTTFSVTVNIDTLNYTPFVTTSAVVAVPAMAVPAGSGIIPSSNPATVNLADAFDQLPH